MKRNLFSKTFSQQRKQVFIIPALSLLFVLLFSSSTFAATSAQKDSISIKQNNVIFVSGNATIIGLENFSNTYIVSLERAETISTKSKVKTLAKTEDHSIAAQIIKKEKAAQVKIAKLQKQINKNAAVTFTLMPSSSDFDSTISRSTNFAIVSNHFHSQLKFLKADSQIANPQNYTLEIKKQKIDASLSYLQFGKYRSSSLRAPPVFS